MLHPLFPLPLAPAGSQIQASGPLRVPDGIRLRGAYIMSSWFALTGIHPTNDGREDLIQTFTENDHCDLLGKNRLITWGNTVVEGAPNPSLDLPYLDPLHAPSDWCQGLPEVFERIFVSTGKKECLRDGIRMVFEEKIKPHHGEAEYFEQDGVQW
ncbi:hypothetical protein J3R30DRAFT_2213523 [Lentinula aciculospora]|uniref:Uncharacterized protein n=1 Tax=Lentinula aciculospora TaxID=153920 RepID=A0A9W8ZVJ9_9AGAR|nr:hypothetical protein J3R30DRAFT_2213523 [Lentinula aciculospora]